MLGYQGDESEVRRQLRGAGKREALIFDIGINTTTQTTAARALEKRELLAVPMPGCQGDESEVRRQLRGAGKREALIFDIGINTTTQTTA
ncbi:hypothetical protein NDU88_001314 [Pleurodeles waltl]|uniref:Uncharacterized protein n=1 Tax=Pleurodeles waltl TaxID=8319 RepID=A0AAV7VW37_PLEWA|nr:hypothetical protein NDU88_001314 [Pleurodeles waltl]